MSERLGIDIDVNGDYTLDGWRYQDGWLHPQRGFSFDKHRCFAILRKLAELSDEEAEGSFSTPLATGELSIRLNNSNWHEEELTDKLWNLLKHKYPNRPLTAEERIENALEVLNKNYRLEPHDVAMLVDVLRG